MFYPFMEVVSCRLTSLIYFCFLSFVLLFFNKKNPIIIIISLSVRSPICLNILSSSTERQWRNYWFEHECTVLLPFLNFLHIFQFGLSQFYFWLITNRRYYSFSLKFRHSTYFLLNFHVESRYKLQSKVENRGSTEYLIQMMRINVPNMEYVRAILELRDV